MKEKEGVQSAGSSAESRDQAVDLPLPLKRAMLGVREREDGRVLMLVRGGVVDGKKEGWKERESSILHSTRFQKRCSRDARQPKHNSLLTPSPHSQHTQSAQSSSMRLASACLP